MNQSPEADNSLQRTEVISPKCPLFGDSTVHMTLLKVSHSESAYLFTPKTLGTKSLGTFLMFTKFVYLTVNINNKY